MLRKCNIATGIASRKKDRGQGGWSVQARLEGIGRKVVFRIHSQKHELQIFSILGPSAGECHRPVPICDSLFINAY
jgi:hypothetical protein